MSLIIIKAGVLDLVQDTGRYGWQHLGINPGGAMDRWSAQLANLLVGNDVNTGLLELHFPAAEFLFESRCLIAVCGADFSPRVNDEAISSWQPVLVERHSVLQFKGWKTGARCYVAINGGLALDPWLSSYSTNLKCAAGGYKGRSLKKGDILPYPSLDILSSHLTGDKGFHMLPWKADWQWNKDPGDEILLLPGNEWERLTDASKASLESGDFIINQHSDRMGYRLEASMESKSSEEMISSAVGFGTVQLLPNGQLIILMADHQTTGGYPRIAHVVSTSLPGLAQKNPGEALRFRMIDIATAEELLLKQHHHLLQLQNACTFRLQHFLHVNQH